MDRYYTASEIAERTGIPERTVMRAMQLKKLRWTTANGTTRPRRAKAEWVTEWLESEAPRLAGEQGAAQESRPYNEGSLEDTTWTRTTSARWRA